MWRLDSKGRNIWKPTIWNSNICTFSELFLLQVGTWQDRFENSVSTSRHPVSNRDTDFLPQNTSSSDLRDKRYSKHRDHSRPRARDCSIDKHTRDPNKRGSSSEQNMYRDCNRSREQSRGSSRDSLDQTYEDNNQCSKPTLQRQGTFTGMCSGGKDIVKTYYSSSN